MFFPEQIVKKGPEGGKPPGIAAGAYFLSVAGEKKIPDMVTVDVGREADFSGGKKIEKKQQIRTIGMNGVLRKPFLGNQVVQETVEQGLKELAAQCYLSVQV